LFRLDSAERVTSVFPVLEEDETPSEPTRGLIGPPQDGDDG
jgi:hypothetical protein